MKKILFTLVLMLTTVVAFANVSSEEATNSIIDALELNAEIATAKLEAEFNARNYEAAVMDGGSCFYTYYKGVGHQRKLHRVHITWDMIDGSTRTDCDTSNGQCVTTRSQSTIWGWQQCNAILPA